MLRSDRGTAFFFCRHGYDHVMPPFDTRDTDLTCDEDGRMRDTRAVHVADGSVFPSLPAKGLTFSMLEQELA